MIVKGRPGFAMVSSDSPQVRYCPGFLDPNEASSLFETLNKTIQWHQPRLFIYGRWVDSPRLAAWYGDSGKT
ncbi:MAG: hypothetical protein ACO3N2_09620, partial [Arenicellales bacterium]